MSNRELSASQAKLLDKWRKGLFSVASDANPKIRATEPAELAPCSFFQEALWHFAESYGPSPMFNISFFAFIDAAVDPESLSTCVTEIAQAHESLRTTFTTVDDVPYQQISQQPEWRLEIEELRHLPSRAADDAALQHATAVYRAPIDPRTAPLARALLYRINETRSAICVVAHHLIADGWSLGVALRQVSQLYAEVAAGRGPSGIDLPIQYRDFAAWHNDWMASRQWDPQLEYWRSQLRGATASKLKPPSTESDEAPPPSGFVAFGFGQDLSEELRALSRIENVSLFMTLLALFAVVLHDFAGETDILIGAPVANRMLPETYELIGLFSNTLALRVDLSGNPAFSTLLDRVRVTCADAFANQEVTIPIYVEETEPGRDMVGDPIYSAQLVLQPRMPQFNLAGAQFAPVELDPGTNLHDLALHLWDEDDLRGNIEYNAEKLDWRLVPKIIGDLKCIAGLVVMNPWMRLEALRQELVSRVDNSEPPP